MNIYEKMSAITNDIAVVNKNLRVGEGKSSYKAVGEADVLAAVRPAEQKYGVYSYPYDREIVESFVITREKSYNGTVSKSEYLFMRVKTTYRFVNVEKPDEYIDIIGYGDGIDTNDKAPGKAVTYSDKGALLKAYKIMSGDDPDQKISEEGRFTTASAPPPAQTQRKAQTPGSAYSDKEKERLRDMILKSCDRAKVEAACARKYGKPFDALTESQLREVWELMSTKKEASVNVRPVGGDQGGTATA